jgi:hypothetical protein
VARQRNYNGCCGAAFEAHPENPGRSVVYSAQAHVSLIMKTYHLNCWQCRIGKRACAKVVRVYLIARSGIKTAVERRRSEALC